LWDPPSIVQLSRVDLACLNYKWAYVCKEHYLVRSDGKSAFIRYIQYSGERHGFSGLKPVLLIVFGIRGRVDHVERVRKSCARTGITLGFVKDATMDEDEITFASVVQ